MQKFVCGAVLSALLLAGCGTSQVSLPASVGVSSMQAAGASTVKKAQIDGYIKNKKAFLTMSAQTGGLFGKHIELQAHSKGAVDDLADVDMSTDLEITQLTCDGQPMTQAQRLELAAGLEAAAQAQAVFPQGEGGVSWQGLAVIQALRGERAHAPRKYSVVDGRVYGARLGSQALVNMEFTTETRDVVVVMTKTHEDLSSLSDVKLSTRLDIQEIRFGQRDATIDRKALAAGIRSALESHVLSFENGLSEGAVNAVVLAL